MSSPFTFTSIAQTVEYLYNNNIVLNEVLLHNIALDYDKEVSEASYSGDPIFEVIEYWRPLIELNGLDNNEKFMKMIEKWEDHYRMLEGESSSDEDSEY